MTVEEKALELLAQNRVVEMPGHADPPELIVAGEHGHYLVMATSAGIVCECPAKIELCAHALAAMVVWAERDAVAAPW